MRGATSTQNNMKEVVNPGLFLRLQEREKNDV